MGRDWCKSWKSDGESLVYTLTKRVGSTRFLLLHVHTLFLRGLFEISTVHGKLLKPFSGFPIVIRF